jgi:methyl-accepting chemotaxis protein
MTGHSESLELVFDKTRTYKTATFMVMSAMGVSASVIVTFNTSGVSEAAMSTLSGVQLTAVTLMPYMISAVIAAITAIGVMMMLPATKMVEPTRQFVACLNEMSAGDLTVRVRLKAEDPLRDVANSFNNAAASLGGEIACWKVINRQQWGALCHIRDAIESGDCVSALRFVEEMEQSWDKIAEIEQRLIA